MKKLQRKIALITGASRGIGYAVAKRFIEEGAHVITVARTVGGLEELDDYAKSLGSSTTIVPLDLLEFDKIDQLGYALYQKFGKLDILIGNAGMIGESAPVGHIDPAIWAKTINLNLNANYRLIRSMDPLLKQSNEPKVIFTTSTVSECNPAYFAAYTASKAGLEALANTYANEEANSKLEVNIVAPGMVKTALRAKVFPGEDASLLQEPDEVANIYVELAIKEAKLSVEF